MIDAHYSPFRGLRGRCINNKHMKSRLLITVILTLGISCVYAKSYIAAVGGTSAGAGTLASPYDIATAITKPASGDTVYIRGGMYMLSTSLSITKSGNSTTSINIWAYPNEIPVLDFRNQPYNSNNAGVKLTGSYLFVKGITIQGAGDNGMIVTGSNNRIEKCIFRWNCDSGLQLKTGSSNLIINCDSYENFDYKTGGTAIPDYGGNADGFADKQYTNAGTNSYIGCRSWLNSDDGWDHYEKTGNTTCDNCWCYANGPASYDMTDHIRFKTDSATWFYQFKNTSGRYIITNYGNGNGFKLGGNYTAHNATLHHCVSVKNKVKGFDQNNNNGTMTVYNCTGYLNDTNYGFSNSSFGTLVIKNCASLSSTSANKFACKVVTQEYNSWNTGFSCTAADFASLDYTQLLTDRQADGSLPEISLLHLVSTSALIDKGINLGYNYFGNAPDLGAFEFNTVSSVNLPNAVADISTYYSILNKQIIVRGSTEKVEIYNISGKKMYDNAIITDNQTIATPDWAKGIYILKAFTEKGNLSVFKILIP